MGAICLTVHVSLFFNRNSPLKQSINKVWKLHIVAFRNSYPSPRWHRSVVTMIDIMLFNTVVCELSRTDSRYSVRHNTHWISDRYFFRSKYDHHQAILTKENLKNRRNVFQHFTYRASCCLILFIQNQLLCSSLWTLKLCTNLHSYAFRLPLVPWQGSQTVKLDSLMMTLVDTETRRGEDQCIILVYTN